MRKRKSVRKPAGGNDLKNPKLSNEKNSAKESQSSQENSEEDHGLISKPCDDESEAGGEILRKKSTTDEKGDTSTAVSNTKDESECEKNDESEAGGEILRKKSTTDEKGDTSTAVSNTKDESGCEKNDESEKIVEGSKCNNTEEAVRQVETMLLTKEPPTKLTGNEIINETEEAVQLAEAVPENIEMKTVQQNGGDFVEIPLTDFDVSDSQLCSVEETEKRSFESEKEHFGIQSGSTVLRAVVSDLHAMNRLILGAKKDLAAIKLRMNLKKN